MIIDADIGNATAVKLDAEGITITQTSMPPVEAFITYKQLRDINALTEALGRQAHYNALVEKYASPLFGDTP